MYKRIAIITVASVIFALTCLNLYANPGYESMVAYLGINPSVIGIWSEWGPLDYSGMELNVGSSLVVVDNGVIIPCLPEYEAYILDSTNTSGFVLDQEGDVVSTETYYFEPVAFGCHYRNPAPLEGKPIVTWEYYNRSGWLTLVLCWDDIKPYWGNSSEPEPAVRINEVSQHSTWPQSGNFIELYNRSDTIVSLTGWRLICDDVYEFPPGAYIMPGGFYIVDEIDFPIGFDMDISLDNIYLIDNVSGNNYSGRLFDQVGWSSDHGEDISFMRYPDGDVEADYDNSNYYGYNDQTSSSFENGFPSRCAPNRNDSPGFVVIGVSADSVTEGQARIHWTNPVWDPEYQLSILVRNFDHYPESVSDGTILYEGTLQEYIEYDVPPEQIYYYTLFAENVYGEYSLPTAESQDWVAFGGLGIDQAVMPDQISLMSCYPNPFNASANIALSLTEPGRIEIIIYNVNGQLVEKLSDDIYHTGEHILTWDAANYPSGLYFARAKAGSQSLTEKLVLLK